MYKKIIKKLENKNIAILGFGLEGKSTYRFIRRYLSQRITIIDQNDITTNELLKNDSQIDFVIGTDYLNHLDQYDLIIKSPGISLKDIDISNIKDRITSQLELVLEVMKQNIIGITGTKGKSTTTSLIYECFKANHKDAFILGNIGKPLLDQIEQYHENTILVIEMSSHQLEFVKTSPHTGIILNLFQDHLDHAGSVKHYHECKLNMFRYMTEQDRAIYCEDNPNLNYYMTHNHYEAKKYSVSLQENSYVSLKNNQVICEDKVLYDVNEKRNLVGNHNLENIMVTLLVCKLYHLDLEKCREVIQNFKPLEHRLELVGTYQDIIYYNDTIATIPAATINGIEALKKVNTLIFGGMDRHIDYEEFITYLKNCDVENLICMPTTGYHIGKLLEQDKKVFYADTLEKAVEIAKKVTKKNMICLLSPAASSYEYFKNFEEKGNAYKDLVRK